MSWRNIAEQYYVRITELEAEIARLSEALDGALAADWSSLRETLARQEEREALLRDIQAMREQYAPLEKGEAVMLDTLEDKARARTTP